METSPMERCKPNESKRTVTRKQAIIDAATRLFREKGFQAAGTAELAERAGLSIAQVYRDFKSKDGLILAIVARVCERYCASEEVDRAIAEVDPISARRWIEGLLNRSLDDDEYGLMPELLATATRSDGVSRLMAKLDADLTMRLGAALRIVAPSATEAEVGKALFLISAIIIGIPTRRRAVRVIGRPIFVEDAQGIMAGIIDGLIYRGDRSL